MTISVLNDIRIPFIPVLTSRDSVKINYHLQAVIPCPLNSLKEIFMLPLDIRLVGCDFVGPIPYWDAHVIESETRIQTWLTDFCSEAPHATYPAPAIDSKSASVIHVSQWFTSVALAVLRS